MITEKNILLKYYSKIYLLFSISFSFLELVDINTSPMEKIINISTLAFFVTNVVIIIEIIIIYSECKTIQIGFFKSKSEVSFFSKKSKDIDIYIKKLEKKIGYSENIIKKEGEKYFFLIEHHTNKKIIRIKILKSPFFNLGIERRLKKIIEIANEYGVLNNFDLK